MNSAAGEMLGVAQHDAEGALLDDVVPALAGLRQRAARSVGGSAQDQLHLSVRGRGRDLLARITPKADDGSGGAVLTLDDLTELVAAQRMAAWGDVARRVAHEIKNPLTPIQLSADRLRRKFGKLPEEDRKALDQYADVIVRQAGDIRRMVDAFSKFARMPEPHVQGEDLAAILRGAVFLQQSGSEDIVYTLDAPDAPVQVACDRGLMNQALTNLLKNAAEAIQARLAAEPDGPPGEIAARLTETPESIVIEITDNGTGLPEADRERLMEPYVTTRAKGTGLGLAIVRKVIEQHGGTIAFDDARETVPRGARVCVTLPNDRGGTKVLPDRSADAPPRGMPVAQPAE
jgi:two-component system nitrogen regulation sensor histidine kinase NtrY